MSKICQHGLTDQTKVTDRTVIEDYRYGTRQTTLGFWCDEHKKFGYHSFKEKDVEYNRKEALPMPGA